jgi:maleylacetoacetate isomerase
LLDSAIAKSFTIVENRIASFASSCANSSAAWGVHALILHEFSLSSASYRVRIALNLKGLSYQTRSYRLRAGEQRAPDYLAINPAGLVPTLEIDGRKLTQSLAIIDYLDATRPEPRLMPTEPAERARVLAMALTIACDIHPLNNLRVLQYLENILGAGEAVRNNWYSEWIAAGFCTLEAMVQETPQYEFAMGQSASLADICLVPQIYNARRYNIDLTPYPRLVKIADHAAALPAFARAAPAN